MKTIFDIIADPTRRDILNLLVHKPYTVGELVEALDISQPGVSKQLRVLRDAGLVHVHKDAQKRWYVLHPEPLQAVDEWLADYRLLWTSRYNQLDRYLEQLQMSDQSDQEEGDSDDKPK